MIEILSGGWYKYKETCCFDMSCCYLATGTSQHLVLFVNYSREAGLLKVVDRHPWGSTKASHQVVHDVMRLCNMF